MSQITTSVYADQARFCQPFIEFMMQVVVVVKARKLNLNMLLNQLHRQIEDVRAFSLESRQQEDAVNEAMFAVCAWTDEHIMNAQWESVSERWSQNLLQMRYFNTNLAGDLFFERMDSLNNKTRKAQGVFAFCLVNGFKGKYVYNLSIEELELRRQQAVSGALNDAGLMDHRAETFPSLEGLVKMRTKPEWDWRKYLPVAVTILCLAFLYLLLAGMLQLNIVNILIN